MSRARLAVALAAIAAGGVAFAVVYRSDREDHPVAAGMLALLVGWSFIGAGFVARVRRPDNRVGVLMVATGFAWFAGDLAASNEPGVFIAGWLLSNLALATYAHLLLAYPSGRIESHSARTVAICGYLITVPLQLVTALFLDPTAPEVDCADCPSNPMAVWPQNDVATGLLVFQLAAAFAVVAAILVVVARRWRNASQAARRAHGPVLFAGTVTLSILLVYLVTEAFVGTSAFRYVALGALALVPGAFLLGLLKLRLRNLKVLRLLVELARTPAPGRLREALARALGDPSLELAYWIEGDCCYRDFHGREVELPPVGGARASTVVERDGNRVAVLLHDASLSEQRELVEAVCAAAGLALQNERLQAELRSQLDQLRVNEGRLRALIEASPLAIVEVGLDGHVSFWNRAAEHLYGWSAAESVGEPISFVPRERSTERDELRERLLGGETIPEIETQRLRRDGTLIDVTLSAAPVHDADGAVTGFMAVSADISARKRAEDELRRERDFISAVIDTAATLVIVTDRDGRFVRFNHACEALTGYSEEEVLGRPYWELFIDPAEAARIRGAVGRVWAGEFPSDNDNYWILRDGSRRLIAWANTALLDDSGEIEYMVSSGVDITARKRAEEEVRASRARIVEAGDEERRRLERNLHDGAQQRLVALSLALRMARSQMRPSPDAAEELLDDAAQELALALDELRELARGIHPAVLTDRGLEAALEALAARSPSPVDLRVSVGERLPPSIEAAAYYVVSEALANIAKYARATAVDVLVERRDGEALVEVADDGVGGADADQGSGLRGLADRVEALDGALDVDSRAGAGTRIRARIPVVVPVANAGRPVE